MAPRLFGKSVATKYEELAASLGPSGCAEFADPITWAALGLAHEEICRRYAERIAFHGDVESGRRLWKAETFRLINDGYILGRIEAGTQESHLNFSGIGSQDPAYEAGEFAMVAGHAIAAGCEQGKFTGPPPSEVSDLLRQFAMDAGGAVLDYLEEGFLIGEANSRAINLGRELAMIEDFYVSAKKRKELLKIRARLNQERLLEFDRIRETLARAGMTTPEAWSNQMMRAVYQRVRI